MDGLRTRYSDSYGVDVNADRLSTGQTRGVESRPAPTERVQDPPSALS
jgi:hypothetical protein